MDDDETHSIVFSTSSSPRFGSRSLLPSVARRSPTIFSTCPQTCEETVRLRSSHDGRWAHLIVDTLLRLLLLSRRRDGESKELCRTRRNDVSTLLVRLQRDIVLSLDTPIVSNSSSNQSEVLLTASTASPRIPGRLKKNLLRSKTPSVLLSLSAFVRASRIGWNTASALDVATAW